MSANECGRLLPRVLGRASLISMLASCLIALNVAPASAHYVYDNEPLSMTNDMCVWVRSEISHGHSDHGYSRGDVKTLASSPSWSHCTEYDGHAPYYAWMHGVQLVAKYYTSSTNTWHECFRTKFATRESAYSSKAPLYWDAACGYGYYGTWTWAGAQARVGDAWHGDWVYSGMHYLRAINPSASVNDLPSLDVLIPPPPPSDGDVPPWDPTIDPWAGADLGVMIRSADSGGLTITLAPNAEEACAPLFYLGIDPSTTCAEPDTGTIPPEV